LTAYSETTPAAVTTAIESLFCNIDTSKSRDEYANAIEEPGVDVKKLVDACAVVLLVVVQTN
jgi:hypothetical protein